MAYTGAAGDNAPPLVSVVIPTYNRPEYLRLALASAVAQTYRQLEIVVQDNGSERDPRAVVAAFADPRIAYHHLPATVSQTENLVTACARARGRYLAILGDDDLWHAEFVERLLQPLEQDTSLVLAFCDHGIIDAYGRPDPKSADKVSRRFGRHRLRPGVHRPFDELALVQGAICVYSGALLRRDAIAWKDMRRDIGFGPVDLYVAYLAARTGQGCYYLPERLMDYRYHLGSIGSSLRQADRRAANARYAMLYWEQLLSDQALRRNHRYFEMKRGLNALVAAVSLFRCRRWREAVAELARFWRRGLLPPRILFYHLIYAFRLRRVNA